MREFAFVGTTYEGRKSLLHATIVALLANAVLLRQHLDAALTYHRHEPFIVWRRHSRFSSMQKIYLRFLSPSPRQVNHR